MADIGTRGFASDNFAGAHPEVLAALAEANGGHAAAYGQDPWTDRLGEVVRSHFGDAARVFPVFNGTAANVISLQAVLPKWGAVICAEGAHVNTDENGAPERVAGIKLVTVPTAGGKLTPALVETQAWGFGDEHHAQPAAVSVTQATEVGTTYTPSELRALAEQAHALGMRLHVDGARLANSAAFLGVPLREITTDAGVDVVSLGGTKNGALMADAVVVLDPALAGGLKYLRKMDMQLASKMRFLSAQLVALFEDDLWLRSASHANSMAQRLAAGLGSLEGVTILYEVQANGVFCRLREGAVELARRRFAFFDWDNKGAVRLMCAWDTTEEDVDAFVETVGDAAADGQSPFSAP